MFEVLRNKQLYQIALCRLHERPKHHSENLSSLRAMGSHNPPSKTQATKPYKTPT